MGGLVMYNDKETSLMILWFLFIAGLVTVALIIAVATGWLLSWLIITHALKTTLTDSGLRLIRLMGAGSGPVAPEMNMGRSG
jgi:hypothetical protein